MEREDEIVHKHFHVEEFNTKQFQAEDRRDGAVLRAQFFRKGQRGKYRCAGKHALSPFCECQLHVSGFARSRFCALHVLSPFCHRVLHVLGKQCFVTILSPCFACSRFYALHVSGFVHCMFLVSCLHVLGFAHCMFPVCVLHVPGLCAAACHRALHVLVNCMFPVYVLHVPGLCVLLHVSVLCMFSVLCIACSVTVLSPFCHCALHVLGFVHYMFPVSCFACSRICALHVSRVCMFSALCIACLRFVYCMFQDCVLLHVCVFRI